MGNVDTNLRYMGYRSVYLTDEILAFLAVAGINGVLLDQTIYTCTVYIIYTIVYRELCHNILARTLVHDGTEDGCYNT